MSASAPRSISDTMSVALDFVSTWSASPRPPASSAPARRAASTAMSSSSAGSTAASPCRAAARVPDAAHVDVLDGAEGRVRPAVG